MKCPLELQYIHTAPSSHIALGHGKIIMRLVSGSHSLPAILSNSQHQAEAGISRNMVPDDNSNLSIGVTFAAARPDNAVSKLTDLPWFVNNGESVSILYTTAALLFRMPAKNWSGNS